jgi:hypothetical protein
VANLLPVLLMPRCQFAPALLTAVSSTPAVPVAKFATGVVVETGGKFASGVADTSGAP